MFSLLPISLARPRRPKNLKTDKIGSNTHLLFSFLLECLHRYGSTCYHELHFLPSLCHNVCYESTRQSSLPQKFASIQWLILCAG